MRWLLWIAIALLAGCTTVNTTSDTDVRTGTTSPSAAEGQELPAIPHPGEPCTSTCRHYGFAGRWYSSHLHFQGCPHVLDGTLKRWTFR